MQICSYFMQSGEASYGLIEEDHIRDAGERLRARFPTVRDLLAANAVEELARAEGARLAADRVQMRPPIPQPDKIICVGLNYMGHIQETGRDTPAYPSIFTRYADSIVGQRQDMVCPKASERFDFEGELALVIGRAARHVSAADAMAHVAGYSCFNDGSIRDFQRHTSQFWPGKSFERSGAMGPALVTTDAVGDPRDLTLQTRLNGQTVQETSVGDLAFDVPAIIAYLSTVITLLPGDVIATGTPSGVGAFRDPPLWMKAGDVVEVEISKIGTLRNSIVNEA